MSDTHSSVYASFSRRALARLIAATEWGTKDFYVEDPDGYIIGFGGRPVGGQQPVAYRCRPETSRRLSTAMLNEILAAASTLSFDGFYSSEQNWRSNLTQALFLQQ